MESLGRVKLIIAGILNPPVVWPPPVYDGRLGALINFKHPPLSDNCVNFNNYSRPFVYNSGVLFPNSVLT